MLLQLREAVCPAECALEGVRGGDDAPLVEEVADDLQADREAVAQAAREAEGRQARDRTRQRVNVVELHGVGIIGLCADGEGYGR